MSDERELLLDGAARMFADGVTAQLRARAEAGDWPTQLWQTLADAGLTVASLPEALGGAGVPLADAFALNKLVGAYAAPLPLAEHLVAVRVLAEQGIALPLATGAPVTFALVAAGDDFAVRGGVAHGSVAGVPWGRAAALALVVAADGAAAVIAPQHATIERGCNLAGEPRDVLRCAGIAATQVDLGAWLPDVLLVHLALARSAALAGALATVLTLTLDYVQTRKQFGKPISGFQAVQHQLAVLAGEVAAAQRATDAALDAVGTPAVTREVAAAKARVGEAAGVAAAIAQQMHGAMGFTHEHHLHHFTRRLWAWRDEYGNETYWQRRLGREFAAAGADRAWPLLCAG